MTVVVTGYGWPRNLFPWVDNGYWWHLAAGDYIIDKRSMPSPDPWLYTYDGKFVAHEWLGGFSLRHRSTQGIPDWHRRDRDHCCAQFAALIAAIIAYGLSYRACTLFTVDGRVSATRRLCRATADVDIQLLRRPVPRYRPLPDRPLASHVDPAPPSFSSGGMFTCRQ
ncbi:MAG: hypothetical protein R2839_03720 [Thermomicrobiales bacterium]